MLSAEAAPKKDFRRKPTAPDVFVKVLRGRTEVIRLPGVESNGNAIRYEIASRPSAGKLSLLEQPDPNRQGHGFVTYAHGDDEKSTTDEFEYRVFAPISGLKSSPGTVRIRILDLPPRLGAPSTLAFSAIVGESSTAMLSLTNIGGGTLSGAVRVRPPFSVAGGGAFELGRGRSTNIALRYTPHETGLSAPEKIQPARQDPGASIMLRGEATAPFAVKTTAEKLDLKADDSRSVEVELVNLSSQPQKVTVGFDPSALVEEIPPAALAPGETRAMTLRIRPSRKGPAEHFTATFSTPAFSLGRSFAAPAVPSRIEVVTPEIDFGRSREAVLEVRNSGGVDGRFSVVLPLGVTSIEGAASFPVSAGQEKKVRLRLDTKDEDTPPTELLVTTPAGERERVAIRAVAPELAAAPTPTPEAQAAPEPPPPPPPPGTLNENIRLARENGRWRLEWNLPQDWTDPRAERMDAGGGAWRPHEEPRERQGWLAWIAATPSRIIGFFSGLTRRQGIEDIRPDVAAGTVWQGIALSEQDARAPGRWRLTAKRAGSQTPEAVTEEFAIDADARSLRAAEPTAEVAPAASVAEPSPPPSPAAEAATAEAAPTTKLEAAQQSPQRKSNRVLLAIPYDPAVDGYRLERLRTVFKVDPASGLPRSPEFQVMPHEGKVTFISKGRTQQGGKDLLMVVATIDGLQPGSGTTWRLVPTAGGKDLAPTGEFVVTTLPPWRLSWSSVFFWGGLMLLAGVFYLRWRINRVPS